MNHSFEKNFLEFCLWGFFVPVMRDKGADYDQFVFWWGKKKSGHRNKISYKFYNFQETMVVQDIRDPSPPGIQSHSEVRLCPKVGMILTHKAGIHTKSPKHPWRLSHSYWVGYFKFI